MECTLVVCTVASISGDQPSRRSGHERRRGIIVSSQPCHCKLDRFRSLGSCFKHKGSLRCSGLDGSHNLQPSAKSGYEEGCALIGLTFSRASVARGQHSRSRMNTRFAVECNGCICLRMYIRGRVQWMQRFAVERALQAHTEPCLVLFGSCL